MRNEKRLKISEEVNQSKNNKQYCFQKKQDKKKNADLQKLQKNNIEQQECDKKPGMTSAAPEG